LLEMRLMISVVTTGAMSAPRRGGSVRAEVWEHGVNLQSRRENNLPFVDIEEVERLLGCETLTDVLLGVRLCHRHHPTLWRSLTGTDDGARPQTQQSDVSSSLDLALREPGWAAIKDRVQSAHRFDAEWLVKRLSGSFDALTRLDVCFLGWSDLALLAGLTSLEAVEIKCLRNLRSLDGLEQLPALRSLSLHLREGQALPDMSALKAHGAVEKLLISASDLGVIDIGAMPSVTTLTLESAEDLSDLSTLGLSRSLRTLELGLCPALTRLEGIQSASALEHLSVTTCQTFVDLGGLLSLTRLKSVTLSDCAALKDLTPLLSLPSLESITLIGFPKGRERLSCSTMTPVELREALGRRASKRVGAPKRSDGIAGALTHVGLSRDRAATAGPLDRKQLASIRRLLKAPDFESVSQALAISAAFGAEGVWNELASGLSLLPTHLSGYETTFESGCSDDISTLKIPRDSALWKRVRPPYRDEVALWALGRCGRLDSLRHVHVREVRNLAAIVGLTALETMSVGLFTSKLSEPISGLDTLPGLQRLGIQSRSVNSTSGLQRLTELKLLHLRHVEDLDSDCLPKSLETLRLDRCRISDAFDLSAFENLRTIELSEVTSPLEWLRQVPQLERLVLCSTTQRDVIREVSGLKSLRSLVIKHAVRQSWPGSLRELPLLERLELTNCTFHDVTAHGKPAPERVQARAVLPNLRSLSVHFVGSITNLRWLGDYPALEHLKLRRCDNLASLAGLEDLSRLASLSVELCPEVPDLGLVEGARLAELKASLAH
jgi:hypothetical protein